MELLTPEGLEELNRRFGHFHDAAIRKVEFNFAQTGSKSVRFEMEVIELPWVSQPDKHGYLLDWKQVVIEVKSLAAYRLEQWFKYEGSVIFELSIGWCDDLVYIDFDSDGDTHPELDQGWMDGSLRWALGKELWWEVRELK